MMIPVYSLRSLASSSFASRPFGSMRSAGSFPPAASSISRSRSCAAPRSPPRGFRISWASPRITAFTASFSVNRRPSRLMRRWCSTLAISRITPPPHRPPRASSSPPSGVAVQSTSRSPRRTFRSTHARPPAAARLASTVQSSPRTTRASGSPVLCRALVRSSASAAGLRAATRCSASSTTTAVLMLSRMRPGASIASRSSPPVPDGTSRPSPAAAGGPESRFVPPSSAHTGTGRTATGCSTCRTRRDGWP